MYIRFLDEKLCILHVLINKTIQQAPAVGSVFDSIWGFFEVWLYLSSYKESGITHSLQI